MCDAAMQHNIDSSIQSAEADASADKAWPMTAVLHAGREEEFRLVGGRTSTHHAHKCENGTKFNRVTM